MPTMFGRSRRTTSSKSRGSWNVASKTLTAKPARFRYADRERIPSGGYGFITRCSMMSYFKKYACVRRISGTTISSYQNGGDGGGQSLLRPRRKRKGVKRIIGKVNMTLEMGHPDI